MNNIEIISKSFSKSMDNLLAASLTKRFHETKKAINLRNYEQTLSHGGKFAEIVFHWLKRLVTGSVHQNLGSINSLVKEVENLGSGYPLSIRIHVPRLMRVVYGFRSKSGGAHWSPDITPSHNEAKAVWGMVQYTMVEVGQFLMGLKYAGIAHLIERPSVDDSPLVEILDGKPHINIPNLSALKSIMLILYSSQSNAMTTQELRECLPEFTPKNIRESIRRAAKKKLVKSSNGNVIISSLGGFHAEKIIEEYA